MTYNIKVHVSEDKRSATIPLPEGEGAIEVINIVRNKINNNPKIKESVKAGIDGKNITLSLKGEKSNDIAQLIVQADVMPVKHNGSFSTTVNYIFENHPQQAVAILKEWMQDHK